MDVEKENNVKHFLDLIQKSRKGKFKVILVSEEERTFKNFELLQSFDTLQTS